MSDIDAYIEDIRKLRSVGALHFKGPEFEVTLGYPFGEPPQASQARVGGVLGTPAQPVTDAADLVLHPPDLENVNEDR